MQKESNPSSLKTPPATICYGGTGLPLNRIVHLHPLSRKWECIAFRGIGFFGKKVLLYWEAMDAYLSGEAYHALQAVSLLRTPSASDGLLIGHIRGHRFFVEKAFLTGRDFFFSPEEYIPLSRHFEERILGFFTFGQDKRRIQKVLGPLSYGKLLLQIETTAPPKMKIRAWVIEFDKDFYLSPIRLKSSK